MKKLLSSITLAAVLQPSCTKEQPYDLCMDIVSEQTSTPRENLAGLTCASLLDKLNLPLPEDYVILKEKNAVVFASCYFQGYGDFLLQRNQQCYLQIKDFLGIQPITQCLFQSVSYQNELAQLEATYINGETKEGAAGCIMIRSRIDGEKGVCVKEETSYPDEDFSGCPAHEPTHLFVAGTVLHNAPLPWLNEGLADYVNSRLSGKEKLECLAEGFNYEHKGDSIHESLNSNYVSLALSREEHKGQGTNHAAYLTGACVWDYIVTHYGETTFKAIMKDVEQSRFTKKSFVKDILQARIGEEGICGLKARFGDKSIKAFE